MPKYSLPGRRKKDSGRGEKLERESQSPSFFPFLPILCSFRRLLVRLKYKTRLCPPFPPFPCPVFVFVFARRVARRVLHVPLQKPREIWDRTDWEVVDRHFGFTLLRQSKKMMLRTGSAALKVNSSLTRPVSSVFVIVFCKISIVTKFFYLEGCLYRVQLWLRLDGWKQSCCELASLGWV